MNSNNGKNERQELLDKALFSYIGYHHVQNLVQDLDSNREEINKINVPKSLDKWFYKFNSDIENNKRKNKYKNIFKNTAGKVAIIFLVIAISMMVLTVSVDAFRVRVFDLIIENTEKYLSIRAEEGQGRDNHYDDIKGYYVPSYIPEGFEIDTIENYGEKVAINYINELENRYIWYNQSSSNSSLQLDSENAVVEDVQIKGMNGIVIAKEDFTILFWSNEELSFYIISDIELHELIKVAESLEINK